MTSVVSYLRRVFLYDLDEIRHREIHDLMPPRQFQYHIRTEEIVTLE